MQKLVFTNSKGVSVDLTSGDFGITNWKGFDNTGLNLQTQTVPFTDGSVYIDGLLNNRDLTVTLALQDNGNLEKRYELKRRLIEILNPKLGEGVLVYTNNYLSKQIKVVPSIPIFQNKNSNDRGTQKGSLVFTACNPYWEDTEETVIDLRSGVRQIVENKGDVPCSITVDLYTSNIEKPRLINFTENKKIELKGTYDTSINIDTTSGNKNVTTENIDFTIKSYNADINKCAYDSGLGLYVACGDSGLIMTSTDGMDWKKYLLKVGNFNSVCYSEKLDKLVLVGDSGLIVTSTDGINWTILETNISNNLTSVIYDKYRNIFVACGYRSIYTSTDGTNWEESYALTNYNIKCLTFSEDKIVGAGQDRIVTSTNGTDWTEIGMELIYAYLIFYCDKLDLFIICTKNEIFTSSDLTSWQSVKTLSNPGNNNLLTDIIFENNTLVVSVDETPSSYSITSMDGINWEEMTIQPSLFVTAVTYLKNEKKFIFFSTSLIVTSDFINFDLIKVSEYSSNFDIQDICYSKQKSKYIISMERVIYAKGAFYRVGGNSIERSTNGEDWDYVFLIENLQSVFFSEICYSEKLDLFVAVGYRDYYGDSGLIVTSTDGINWTIQNTASEEVFEVHSICFSDDFDLFVGVRNGDFVTSADGINWTRQSSDSFENGSYKKIIYSNKNKLFITVAQDSSFQPENSKIAFSSDLINWTTIRYNNCLLTSVCESEYLNLFIVVGTNILLRSSNGINWIVDNFYSTQFNVITYIEDSNKFLIGGEDGSLLESFFTDFENLIADLTEDSNMNLSLEVGDNELLISGIGDQFNATLKYRQRYVGV